MIAHQSSYFARYYYWTTRATGRRQGQVRV